MKPAMRPNPVRRRLLDGGYSFGTMVFEFFTPGLPAALARAGAEFAIFDMEHSGVTIETTKTMIATSHGAGLVPLVRVSGASYTFMAPGARCGRAWDHGADGGDGRAGAVDRRVMPGTGPRAYTDWLSASATTNTRGGDIVQKMAEANERTLVIALIETAIGIANVDEIMAVRGIDVGWLGHFDLTNTMGITGQFDHPDFSQPWTDCSRPASGTAKRPAFCNTPELIRIWAAKGFRCLGYGTDVALLQTSLSAGIASLREATGSREP